MGQQTDRQTGMDSQLVYRQEGRVGRYRRGMNRQLGLVVGSPISNNAGLTLNKTCGVDPRLALIGC